jgi:UDP-3-O-[3-hydroxymyristoyl] glucosamine N-acyltransferase
LAFVKVVALFRPAKQRHPRGIHPTAIVGKGVQLGRGVCLGAYSVVEEDATIGDGSVIYPRCYIGYASAIGKDTVIYPQVVVRENVTIGNRVIIHSGTVVGSDGFGYVTVEQAHHKIPQVGTVIIEDDVEIGANVAIDRARFDKTVIGSGTKIDNLVHIAHNVTIGKNCLIVAQVGISGSTSVGDNVILAGQVGIVGHIKIGDNAVVLAKSGVSKAVPAGSSVWGYPAKEEGFAKRLNAHLNNLPRLSAEVKELKKKIEELEKKA